jgi:hypothetical protein
VISRVSLAGYLRIYSASHRNPLGYGKGPSRFSDPRSISPRRRFGVVYLNASLKGCFVEAILRDRAVGTPGTFMLEEGEIASFNVVEARSTRDLRLVNLRGDGIVRMRLPTDVARASRQDPCQTQSADHRAVRRRQELARLRARAQGLQGRSLGVLSAHAAAVRSPRPRAR